MLANSREFVKPKVKYLLGTWCCFGNTARFHKTICGFGTTPLAAYNHWLGLLEAHQYDRMSKGLML